MNSPELSTIHAHRPVRALEQFPVRGAIRSRFISLGEKDTLHLTICTGYSNDPIGDSSRLLRQNDIETTNKALEVPMAGIVLLGHQRDSAALAVELEDEDDVLRAEHDYYREALGAETAAFLPHVTLGRIAINSAWDLSNIKQQITKHLPESLRLEPINIGINRPTKRRHRSWQGSYSRPL